MEKIMQIVKILQAVGVLLVSTVVVAWPAFYVLKCHPWMPAQIAGYGALLFAGALALSAIYLGHEIVRVLEEGRSRAELIAVHVVAFLMQASAVVVIGQVVLDSWHYRLGDCAKAGLYGIGL